MRSRMNSEMCVYIHVFEDSDQMQCIIQVRLSLQVKYLSSMAKSLLDIKDICTRLNLRLLEDTRCMKDWMCLLEPRPP